MMPGAMDDVDVGHCYRHPDRETALACSQCGRMICPECMTPTPTGQRCPECVGRTRAIRPRAVAGTVPYVTYALMAINVLVYLVEQGGSFHWQDYDLYAPAVADGEWYRLITSAFLHAGTLHLGVNMLSLYWLGPPIEGRYGPGRFLALYLAAGVGGSAGVVLLQPHADALGASGAIFGLMGALGVVLLRTTGSLAPILPVLMINLFISFSGGIAYGAHIGGLVGGAIVAFVYEEITQRRRGQASAIAAAVAMGLLAAAVAIVAAGRVA
jgi:membrane associated rhomboid family serine protease